MTVLTLTAVFVGGGAGATCRYFVARAVSGRASTAFPLGTVLINVSGCFALGFLASIFAAHTGATTLTALLATGFLGGYTTFSSYALESTRLLKGGATNLALLNQFGSVIMGLAAAALGAGLAHLW